MYSLDVHLACSYPPSVCVSWMWQTVEPRDKGREGWEEEQPEEWRDFASKCLCWLIQGWGKAKQEFSLFSQKMFPFYKKNHFHWINSQIWWMSNTSRDANPVTLMPKWTHKLDSKQHTSHVCWFVDLMFFFSSPLTQNVSPWRINEYPLKAAWVFQSLKLFFLF